MAIFMKSQHKNNYFKNSSMLNIASREYVAFFASKTQKHQVTKHLTSLL
jgi:hypothetical protein